MSNVRTTNPIVPPECKGSMDEFATDACLTPEGPNYPAAMRYKCNLDPSRLLSFPALASGPMPVHTQSMPIFIEFMNSIFIW